MAQLKVLSETAATYLALEDSFGSTPGTMYRAFPVKGTLDMSLEQAEVENEDESIYLFDTKDPVRGMKDGSVKAEFYLKPYATQLSSSVAPTNNYLQQLLKAVFGGHQVHSGSAVSLGTSGTSVNVDHPSRFSIGQWALFATTNGLEPARITNIATNTLTLSPALSSTPASASVVINMDNYYPTESNVNSLTVQHAKAGDSSLQYLLNGCVGGIELKLERNQIAAVTADLKVATWSTGSLGYSTAVGTEVLASPIVVKDAVVLIQATTATTRTAYPLKSLACKMTFENNFLEELGGTEGKTGAMRMGARGFAEATLKFKIDTAAEGYWSNQTKLQIIAMVPVGSSTSKRWLVLDIPTAVPVGRPKLVNDGGVYYIEMMVRSKLSTVNASSSTELSRAPAVLALG